MNKFIRGLNNLDKLDKVLTCMDYNKYDDGFYTLSTSKLKREKGHYIYIENGKKLIFRFYNVNSIIILPLTDVELRLFITKDFSLMGPFSKPARHNTGQRILSFYIIEWTISLPST